MRINVVTPAPPRSRTGNRVTALRWARILRRLGHHVRVTQTYDGWPCDLVVALHARRSAESIERFAVERPERPIVLALTGTDVYDDIRHDDAARRSLHRATRIVVLQDHAVGELSPDLQPRVRVIHQSVGRVEGAVAKRDDVFEICVIGHLRPVKDPFRALEAVKLLPRTSRIQLTHTGAALTPEMAERATRETQTCDRYEWLGECSWRRAMETLARCRLMVLTSVMEGGANVVSESIAAGVPVVSSCIGGSIGLLGADYPGFFSVGDTQALAALLLRVETDHAFRESLVRWCAALRPLIEPDREQDAWAALIGELDPSHGSGG